MSTSIRKYRCTQCRDAAADRRYGAVADEYGYMFYEERVQRVPIQRVPTQSILEYTLYREYTLYTFYKERVAGTDRRRAVQGLVSRPLVAG